MLRKRTTAPDGIAGVISGGELPRPGRIATLRRLPPAGMARAVVELARHHRRLRHRPTLDQVAMMVRFAGREPCTYRLDGSVNWLPESLPVGFPHGAAGLCFAHLGGELVVLPDGLGFSLT